MNEIKHSHGHAHDDIGCLEAIEWLYAWLDGELESDSIEQLEHHLEHCQSCYTRHEMERALTARIKETSGEKTPPSLQDRLNRILDEF
jgi:anti-sigma factor (TIGR02949 family)